MLKSGTAKGIDGIEPEMLKKLGREGEVVLKQILNQMLRTKRIPKNDKEL